MGTLKERRRRIATEHRADEKGGGASRPRSHLLTHRVVKALSGGEQKNDRRPGPQSIRTEKENNMYRPEGCQNSILR